MVKKERPQRVFRRGKKPLGKTSGKVREKREAIVFDEVEGLATHYEFPKISQFIPEVKRKIYFKFPNINRVISENKLHVTMPQIKGLQYVWLGAIAVSVILCLWQLWIFTGIAPRFFKLATTRALIEAELHTWQSIGDRYPTYRDAHVEVAILAYRLGKRDIMEAELKKTLEIDPNFALAEELQKEK